MLKDGRTHAHITTAHKHTHTQMHTHLDVPAAIDETEPGASILDTLAPIGFSPTDPAAAAVVVVVVAVVVPW